MQGLKNRPVLACTGFTMCLVFSGLRLDAADFPGRGLNNEVLRLHGEMQRAVPGRAGIAQRGSGGDPAAGRRAE